SVIPATLPCRPVFRTSLHPKPLGAKLSLCGARFTQWQLRNRRRILMRRAKSGGGWAAIAYTLRIARRVGWLRLWKAMSAKNACKTCALGMGGQLGGMRNESGHWPEVCKKSLQAMVGD